MWQTHTGWVISAVLEGLPYDCVGMCLTCVIIVHLSVEFRSPDESSLHHLHFHWIHLLFHGVKLVLVRGTEKVVTVTSVTPPRRLSMFSCVGRPNVVNTVDQNQNHFIWPSMIAVKTDSVFDYMQVFVCIFCSQDLSISPVIYCVPLSLLCSFPFLSVRLSSLYESCIKPLCSVIVHYERADIRFNFFPGWIHLLPSCVHPRLGFGEVWSCVLRVSHTALLFHGG